MTDRLPQFSLRNWPDLATNTAIAKRRSGLMSCTRSAVCLGLAVLFIGVAFHPSIAAEPNAGLVTLPDAEQRRVDAAIDRGKNYLLKNLEVGRGTFPVGYTALVGLTLLECGEPATNAVVQRSADFVRRTAPRLGSDHAPYRSTDEAYRGSHETYQLSLAVLFLDRLGDPQDRQIIRSMALRLIAGQLATGEWAYKCPLLSQEEQNKLVTALQISTPSPVQLLPTINSMKDSPNLPTINSVKDSPRDKGPKVTQDEALGNLSRQILEGGKRTTGGPKGPAVTTLADLPESIKKLPVLQDENHSVVQIRKIDELIQKIKVAKAEHDKLAKTPGIKHKEGLAKKNNQIRELSIQLGSITGDNSNTQFAMLALWAARRYDIPTERTFALVLKLFQTTQNPDGSWDYFYKNLDHPGNRKPTMTGVGLLGLAVGHGLAHDLHTKATGSSDATRKLMDDRRIQNGFRAFAGHIREDLPDMAKPGKRDRTPTHNLYFLWTVERVAVLYQQKTIDGRDWYRWGAQYLCDQQQPAGNWQKGNYLGHTPLTDTCFALLFLKRTNMAKDLPKMLPELRLDK